VKITDFKFKHINEVIKIEVDAYGADHWNRDIFYSELDKEHSYNKVVLNDDDNPIAFLISSYLFEEAELLSIAVSKKFRGQGISKLLIKDLIRYGKFNGIERIFLEVSEKNNIAKSLYSKLGFKKISTRKNYYSDGSSADIMKLDIVD
jgi:ribosomal-protein-alanine N-acetyltransferase